MQGKFPISTAGLAAAFEFIRQNTGTLNMPKTVADRMCVVVDEVCANLIRHDSALPDGAEMELALDNGPAGVRLTIRDPGAPFDPLIPRESDGGPGGHGLAILRGMARSASYRREGDRNCLVLDIDADGNHEDV